MRTYIRDCNEGTTYFFTLVWSWDPDAFGVLQPAAGLPNGVEINLRFPGQYYDVHSGLYYNHNRYYNPELGRYMEPDPIGLAGGLNPYSYCYNNPLNYVDPTGAVPIAVSVFTGFVGGVAGGASSAFLQIVQNKGFSNFNRKDVGVAAGIGAIAGAAAPYTALSYAGAAVTGAAAAEYQYWISNIVNGQSSSLSGLALNTGAGFVAGPFGGKFTPNPKLTIGPFTYIGPVGAQSINNRNTIAANASTSAFARNFAANYVNGYSTSNQALTTLNNNVYGSYQNGNLGSNPYNWGTQATSCPCVYVGLPYLQR